jgi:hypothetical protein
MYDREFIGTWDLLGRDVTVVIAKVEPRKLKSQRGEDKKPIIFFEGKEKAFVCNKTNGKTIAGMYGPDTTKWIGRPITLYPTTTTAGAEVVDCIRVRPAIPAAPKKGKE